MTDKVRNGGGHFEIAMVVVMALAVVGIILVIAAGFF